VAARAIARQHFADEWQATIEPATAAATKHGRVAPLDPAPRARALRCPAHASGRRRRPIKDWEHDRQNWVHISHALKAIYVDNQKDIQRESDPQSPGPAASLC
jgi:hypothetical protein